MSRSKRSPHSDISSGLAKNWCQFSLLILTDIFVGGTVGRNAYPIGDGDHNIHCVGRRADARVGSDYDDR